MQHLQKTGGYILQAKRFSPSAPFLQSDVQTFPHANVSTCFPTIPFQSFTHSPTQRETRICFSFNHLRTLSIATKGVPPLFPLWNSPPAYPPVYPPHYAPYFHAVTWNPFCKPFIFIFIRVMGCTLLLGVSTGYRLLPIINLSSGIFCFQEVQENVAVKGRVEAIRAPGRTWRLRERRLRNQRPQRPRLFGQGAG